MSNPNLPARVRVRTTALLPSREVLTEPPLSEVLSPLQMSRFLCVPIDRIEPGKTRLRNGDRAQFNAIKAAIGRFGLRGAILVDADYEIIDGYLVWKAAKALGYKEVWVAKVEDLKEAEIRALRIALHKTFELGSYDEDVLKADLEVIMKVDPLLLDFTAIPMPEIDMLTLPPMQQAVPDDEEREPDLPDVSVSRLGDVWEFKGGHRLLCGNSRMAESYTVALGGRRVQMVLSDPPYGVKIAGVVSASHGEFVEGSGLTAAERRSFFDEFLAALKDMLTPGCIVDLFMDHRGLNDLLTAQAEIGLELLAIPVWQKTAGMGGLYSSSTEFITVSKWPGAKHINNIALGRYGRNRTTIWSAPGVAGFGRERDEALSQHPTRKPCSLLAEAIIDTSDHGGVILDPFAGSGSTLVAAHRMGRIGVGIELDPKYVDVAIRRMEAVTGERARHAKTNLTFEETAAERSASSAGSDR